MRAALALSLLLACAPTEPAPSRGAAVEADAWHSAHDRPGLLAALQQAGHGAVVIDVRAAWCVPCLDLERTTLTDPRVRAALRDHVRVQVDVTDGTAEQDALQTALQTPTLPRLRAWSDADALRRALHGGTALPPPSWDVTTYVDANELLARIAAR